MKEIKLKKCRVCGKENLEVFLSFGNMPPINIFPKDKMDMEKEELFPMDAAFCHNCTHVQLTNALDQEDTFSDYIYFSSNSRTFVEHGKWLAEEMKKRLNLSDDDLVVEAASNDGCLLKSFKALPTKVLGVEPAKNIASVAQEAGIPTISKFFGIDSAKNILEKHGPAKVIIGANVLAHAFFLDDFTGGLKTLLAKGGTVLIEVPYIVDLLENNEFDTIYHEHISYFSVYCLQKLFQNVGLEVYNVEHLPIHGGSLLVSIQHSGGPYRQEESVGNYLEKERELGIQDIETYKAFAGRTLNLKNRVQDFLKEAKNSGKSIAAYGAAAKGNVLLQYCGIGADEISFVADKSSYKQGRFTPATHIPVVAPAHILEKKPDYLVILAWNFAKEIMVDMEAYSKTGGKFVVFMPEPKIIN